MKVLMFVLNDADLLSPLLKEFSSVGIGGCTIFDTSGMARELSKRDDFNTMFGTLRAMLKPNLSSTKTLMMVLDDGKIGIVMDAIERIVGDLSQPGTGILFTFPLDFVKGLKL